MNFYGHTVISSSSSDDPAFVFGSMLPDFSSMTRSRPRVIHHLSVSEGVAHHLKTDDVFHSAPGFLERCEAIRADLEALGVNWGAARAVGHVGTELLLDGILLERQPEGRACFDAAMREAARFAPHGAAAGGIEWRDGGVAFGELLRRLDEAPLPDAYREPRHVARILERVLRSRPRLRLEVAEVGIVAQVLEAHRAYVARDADGIVEFVHSGLRRLDAG